MCPVPFRLLSRLTAVLVCALLPCLSVSAAERVQPVKVGAVKRMDVPLYLDRVGTLTASATVQVRPQVSGLVQKAHFSEGELVKEGQLLFSLDARTYEAKLAQARAALEADKAQLDEAQKKVARQEKLSTKDYVSRQDLEDARSQVIIQKAQLEQDRASLRLAELNLAYCRITAPITGRTSLIQVQPGNLATPDGDNPLVVIYQSQPIFVDFDLPETYLPQVRDRAQAGALTLTVREAGGSGKAHEGRTSYLSPQVNSETGTVQVRGVLVNQDQSLWPGHFVRVRLVLKNIPNAVVAPAAAVQQNQEGHYAYVVGADSKAEMRKLKVGEVFEDWQVIEQGLKPGETVVTFGQLNLRPGMKVKPVTDQAEAKQPAGGAAR